MPRNPLDVLSQQIVAMVSMDAWDVDALFTALRRAAPFAELSRGVFEGALDMLSGRYPSDDFADLRPKAHLVTTQKRAADRCLDAIRALADQQRRYAAIVEGRDPELVEPLPPIGSRASRLARMRADEARL